MSSKSKISSIGTGALTGATAGATAGSAFGPYGTVIGGVGGGLIGGLSGYLADDAQTEAQQNDPEYQAAVRREKSRQMMSASLGRAFAAMKTPKLGGPLGL